MENTANLDMLNDTMAALWWNYQQLSPDIRRCFEYCNIFPRRLIMRKEKLIHLWTNCETEHMEDVAASYIQVLVSCSFLQQEQDMKGRDIDRFRIHDLLHDLLDKANGNDCFKTENGRSQRGEGCKGDIDRDVRHLFVQNYDEELIAEKILALKRLRSLIIYVVEEDTPVEEKVIESICKRLPKLRVLAVAFSQEHNRFGHSSDIFSVPESISQLKHLRYLAFCARSEVVFRSTVNKLRQVQLVDFGVGKKMEMHIADLITLRHIIWWSAHGMRAKNIGRLVSLQTIPVFVVRNEQGHEIKQLRDLNKLDNLSIRCLNNVESKREALEANLAAKERLENLYFHWSVNSSDTICSPEIQAEVLEGLCPPMGLKELTIWGYKGSRYPDWMVCKQNGSQKDLQKLVFWGNELRITFELAEVFPHLRELEILHCTWDTLPSNMQHLTSLKRMVIQFCMNTRSLPALPQSLEWIFLAACELEFMKSCQTVGDPNWQKLEHIADKIFSD